MAENNENNTLPVSLALIVAIIVLLLAGAFLLLRGGFSGEPESQTPGITIPFPDVNQSPNTELRQ